MHGTTENGRRARDHAVGGGISLVHTEVRGAMLGKHANLGEGARIHELFDALTSGHLAAVVLLLDALFSATQADALLFLF